MGTIRNIARSPDGKPYSAVLEIGHAKIPCAVLHAITTALGSRSGASKRLKRQSQTDGAPTPVFLAPKSIEPFISNDLRNGLLAPIEYRIKVRTVTAYPARFLPLICDVWLKARDAGALQSQQMVKAKQAEILMRALALTAIEGLVDEATGYQEIRDRDALQKILNQYLCCYFSLLNRATTSRERPGCDGSAPAPAA